MLTASETTTKERSRVQRLLLRPEASVAAGSQLP